MQSPLMHFLLFFLLYLYVTLVCTGKPPEPRNYNWEDTICNRVKIEELQWVEDISRTGIINISLFWIFLPWAYFLYFQLLADTNRCLTFLSNSPFAPFSEAESGFFSYFCFDDQGYYNSSLIFWYAEANVLDYFCLLLASALKSLVFICILVGTKPLKVPVHKMVRTDSQDPAGRLHAYLHVKHSSQMQGKSCLASVR